MLSVDSDNITNKKVDIQLSSGAFKVNHACFLAGDQCCIEQLVLYVRALHLLSSALQHARLELNTGKLTSLDGIKNSKYLYFAFFEPLSIHVHVILNVTNGNGKASA